MNRTEDPLGTDLGDVGPRAFFVPIHDEGDGWMIVTILDAYPCGHVPIYLCFELVPRQTWYWITQLDLRWE